MGVHRKSHSLLPPAYMQGQLVAAPQEIRLQSKSFAPRIYLTPTTPTTTSRLTCPICDDHQSITPDSYPFTTCGHLVRCNECTDYHIEKIYRCEHCCTQLLSVFPPPCSKDCLRLQGALHE